MSEDKIIPFTTMPSNPNVSPIAINIPEIGTLGFGSVNGGFESMDVEAFLNMRDWVREACEAHGAKFMGGGIGLGQADIDIELEGCRYNISIRPLPKSAAR